MRSVGGEDNCHPWQTQATRNSNGELMLCAPEHLVRIGRQAIVVVRIPVHAWAQHRVHHLSSSRESPALSLFSAIRMRELAFTADQIRKVVIAIRDAWKEADQVLPMAIPDICLIWLSHKASLVLYSSTNWRELMTLSTQYPTPLVGAEVEIDQAGLLSGRFLLR